MTPLDYALTSCDRLKGMLLDKASGKVVPEIILRRELDLLTQRIEGLQEPVAFDLTQFRARKAQEADETPVGVDGVADEEDA